MTCRRRDAVAGLVFLGVIAFGFWIAGRRPTAEDGTTIERSQNSEATAPMLRGAPPPFVPELEAEAVPETADAVEATAPEGWVLEGRLLGPTGEPVPDVLIRAQATAEVRGPDRPSAVEATSDAHGRFRLARLLVSPVRLDISPSWGGHSSSLAPIYDREASPGPDPVEIHLGRLPHVTFRLRVAGASPGLYLAPECILSNERFMTEEGVEFTFPGKPYPLNGHHDTQLWEGRFTFRLLGDDDWSPETEPVALEPDGTYVVEAEVPAPPSRALVEVRFDRSPVEGQDVRCAVYAWKAAAESSDQVAESYAAASGVLLLLRPGTWHLTGAIRFGDAVYLAEPTLLRVHAGDKIEARLWTTRAGGIRLPPRPADMPDDTWLDIRSPPVHEHAVVRDPPFKHRKWLRQRAARTLWMSPGTCEVCRFVEEQARDHISVEVKPGEVVPIQDTGTELRVAGD